MHLLPSLLEGGGGQVEPPTKFFKRGLDRTSAFRRELVKKTRVTFFRGVGFYKKDKVKSEIFNDKKSFKTNFFLCINEEFKLGNFN